MKSGPQTSDRRKRLLGEMPARSRAGMLLLLAVGLMLCCSGDIEVVRRSFAGRSRKASAAAVAAYGRLPLSFEKNEGQTDPSVGFLARRNGYTIFLTVDEVVFWFAGAKLPEVLGATGKPGQGALALPAVVRMKFMGADRRARLTGLEELPGKTNYFIGNDRAKWRTGVRNYARVEYSDIYPGIDLAFYGNKDGLEYDWVVHPRADPKRIRMRFHGVGAARLDSSGDLVLRAADGELRLQKPGLYQWANGSRRAMAGRYVLHSGAARSQGEYSAPQEVAFEVGSYDSSRALLIDPVFTYTALIGSSGASGGVNDSGLAIATDSLGGAYVAGSAVSTDFPTVNPLQGTKPARPQNIPNAFVLKINPAGTALVYSTYLGSSGGESSQAMGIAVDASGAAIVTGSTSGNDFPVINPAQRVYGGGGDVFVSKLSPSGSALLYSTYLGGSAFDEGTAVAGDSAGNTYVTGDTLSPNFPTTTGALQAVLKSADAFVTKFGPAGSVVYSTFLGGTSGDYGRAIALDSAGSAYVTGYTLSIDFPTTAGASQATGVIHCSFATCELGFLAKLSPSGSALAYSTYLGGSSDPLGSPRNFANGVAVDSVGNGYVVGSTTTDDFPTTPGAFQTTRQGSADAFVSKFNSSGSALIYSTRIGGGFPVVLGVSTRGGNSGASRIAIDSGGNAYILGRTDETNFPTVRPIQVTLGGCSPRNKCDAFFAAKLNPSGSGLLFSTYLGATGADSGNALALDSAGNAYLTGQWLSGTQTFPQAGPLRFNLGQVFVMKIIDTNNPVVVGAVTNGASFIGGLATGEIATVFGTGITTVSGIVTASTLPLPTRLAGTSLTVNGVPAPLFAVANVNGLEQINFQVPWETASDASMTIPAKIVVTKNGASSDPVYVRFTPENAGIFMVDPNTPAIQHASDYSLVTPSNPAKRGEVIIIYVTGLGLVQPNPGTGNPAPSSPLSQCTDPNIAVSFGNRADLAFLKPLFCGLTPGFVGLYQVNIRIPDATPQGAMVTVQDSNPVPLALQ